MTVNLWQTTKQPESDIKGNEQSVAQQEVPGFLISVLLVIKKKRKETAQHE